VFTNNNNKTVLRAEVHDTTIIPQEKRIGTDDCLQKKVMDVAVVPTKDPPGSKKEQDVLLEKLSRQSSSDPTRILTN
jgi:hypothetical protein